MKTQTKHEGVVVPMVTPLTAGRTLDESAVDRLVEVLIGGKVDGIFVLGTTGEGGRVSRSERQRLVERVVARTQSRARVYAGIGDLHPGDASAGNAYLGAGVDAVVARPPISMSESELEPWYRSLLEALVGPMILYNIPILTRVSIPLDLVERLLSHPRLVGMKDSEDDLNRMKTLIARFGKRPGFSVFVGIGKLMEEGLRLGADGIVPSVGNLIPETCHQLWECARRGDWAGARQHSARMNSVAAVYQRGRDLGESLSALKGVLSLQRVCDKYMLPPLEPVSDTDLQALAKKLEQLHLSTGQAMSNQRPSASPSPSTRALSTP